MNTGHFVWIALAAVLALTSCGEQEQPPAAKPAKPAATKAAPAVAKDDPVVQPRVKLTNNSCAKWLLKYGEENPETVVLVHTPMGDIKVRLYKDTPIHRANFIRLVKERYFERTLFTRVEKGFIIQGGKSEDEYHEVLRSSFGEFSLPSEFLPHRYHKRGVLAAAREYRNNPNKRSSPFDFYFVQGQKSSAKYMKVLEEEKGRNFPDERRDFYLNNAGAPHLDMEHTVFGEIIEGLDVVDKIAEVKVDGSMFPVNDVEISMEIVE